MIHKMGTGTLYLSPGERNFGPGDPVVSALTGKVLQLYSRWYVALPVINGIGLCFQ